MAQESKIEWCDGTFNPWIGCTKVSPGCAHCYAEGSTRARVLRADGQETWGKGAPRSRTQTWNDPVKWNRMAASCGQHQGATDCPVCSGPAGPHRMRIFCASLADWLDDEVPIEWLSDLLELIHATPNLDWLLLTKRPENWYRRVSLATGEMAESWIDCIDMPERGTIPHNVWLGTTVEDQTRADERIPILLGIPAAVRFLSCEPLLGPVDLSTIGNGAWLGEGQPWLHPLNGLVSDGHGDQCSVAKIDWVICGGESGPQARPMHPDWARSIRDQCVAANVPFLFKQWGEFREYDHGPVHGTMAPFTHAAEAVLERTVKPSWIQTSGKHHLTAATLPQGVPCRLIERLGKHAAGRTLDGVEWTQYPAASSLKTEH